MNYQEIEYWIQENIIKDNHFSLDFLSKGKKILDYKYYDTDFSFLDGFLKKTGKSIQKDKNLDCVHWFKINFIDNVIPDLAGLGKISNLEDLGFISSLLKYDKAQQNGEIVVGIFDKSKEWLIEITHSQDENRIYIKSYGKGKVIDLLE